MPLTYSASRLIAFLFVLAISGSIPAQTPNSTTAPAGVELAVAAPDELNSPLTELAREFEQKTGNRVRLTFDDSASLVSQMKRGSGLDALFLADMSDLRRLSVAGKLLSTSLREYARDQLVLCIAPGVRFAPRPGNPLLLLNDKRIPHIAIVDPHSSLGRITIDALKAARVYDVSVRERLFVAENVAKLAQLMEHGNVEVALLPNSALQAYQLRGTRVIAVPSRPLVMGAAVVRRSQHPRQAQAFLRFAVSPDGKDILRQFGFNQPQRTVRARR